MEDGLGVGGWRTEAGGQLEGTEVPQDREGGELD